MAGCYKLLLLGFGARIGLMLYGEIQDRLLAVKYTDIDYCVYTDAARFMWEGGSPYDRATYRYTPLLAMLMIPNLWLPWFGKFLFVLADLAVAYTLIHLIRRITGNNIHHHGARKRNEDFERRLWWSVAFWLFNPHTLTVSTRGNADVLVVAMVLGCLALLVQGSSLRLGVLFGLCIHFKIYPIIYAPIFLIALARTDASSSSSSSSSLKSREKNQTENTLHRPHTILGEIQNMWRSIWLVIQHLFDIQSITTVKERERGKGKGRSRSRSRGNSVQRFVLATALTLIGTTVIGYWMYGWTFVFETYLYHLVRRDVKHNFSVYFYWLYLSQGSSGSSSGIWKVFSALIGFIPQLGTVAVLGCLFSSKNKNKNKNNGIKTDTNDDDDAKDKDKERWEIVGDPYSGAFLCTYAFVIFNKVITAQYFIWIIALLPLVAHKLTIKGEGMIVGGALVISYLLWLAGGYLLEFQGMQVFQWVFVASALFFAVNIYTLGWFIRLLA